MAEGWTTRTGKMCVSRLARQGSCVRACLGVCVGRGVCLEDVSTQFAGVSVVMVKRVVRRGEWVNYGERSPRMEGSISRGGHGGFDEHATRYCSG